MSVRSKDIAAPIQRRTLHGEVAARLRDMIIEGDLAAGERLNEIELGLKLGVSRTPLREAIRTLTSEGLIAQLPSRGAFVRRFGIEDVRHMLEAIKAIEQTAARLAARRATDEEIADVLSLHAAMMGRYKTRKRLAYYKLNQAIHSAIVRAAHNPALAEMHDMLQARMKRIRYLGNGAPDKWAAAVAEHEEMACALEARDGNQLADVLGRHMDRTLERVHDVL